MCIKERRKDVALFKFPLNTINLNVYIELNVSDSYLDIK